MNYRVLLVEDDPSLIRAINDLLLEQGYAQDTASNKELATQMGIDERKVRIEAFVRRAVPSISFRPQGSYQFGSVKVDFHKSEIARNGLRIALSERESRLLRYLIENRDRIVSRDTLLEQVWGYPKAPLTRTVDVTILRLRQKIETNPHNPRYIVTVHGLGYRFGG